MEGGEPAPKKAKIVAVPAGDLATLFSSELPENERGELIKLVQAGPITVGFRMKTDRFNFQNISSAAEVAETICTALCIPDNRVLLERAKAPPALGGTPSGTAAAAAAAVVPAGPPRFEASVPDDINLEDIADFAELARTPGGGDQIQSLLERCRVRYGGRTDTWKAFAINGEWQALAEDAIFTRLEGSSARLPDNDLHVDWVQEPAWGACEWLMLHKRKDNSWSNAMSPAVSVRLKRRVSSDQAVVLDAPHLQTAKLVLLGPDGKDRGADGKDGNLRVGNYTTDAATAGLTFPELGIKQASEKYPSKNGMRAGKKTQRGARGWYNLAVHVPGLGLSLLWDPKMQKPCDIVIKHFRNKWGEKEGEEKRGPWAPHDACQGSHVQWVENGRGGGEWQLRCGGWRPGGRARKAR